MTPIAGYLGAPKAFVALGKPDIADYFHTSPHPKSTSFRHASGCGSTRVRSLYLSTRPIYQKNKQPYSRSERG